MVYKRNGTYIRWIPVPYRPSAAAADEKVTSTVPPYNYTECGKLQGIFVKILLQKLK